MANDKKIDMDTLHPSNNPNDYGVEINNWEDLFEFQKRKDGASYLMLKNWLMKYCEFPKLKSNED